MLSLRLSRVARGTRGFGALPPAFRDIGDVEKYISSRGPQFSMKGSCVDILATPAQFYNTLKLGAKTAKSRVVLSCLYLGNGQLESDLVSAMMENNSIANSSCSVNVLVDYTRGTRGQRNSTTMLLPLRKMSSNCTVSLFHSPDLRGPLRLLPPPFNEVIGLNHLKVFCFDDTLVLSGANLSHDYFTTREDRFFVFRDRPLADFFCELIATVGSHSLHLDHSGAIACKAPIHPYEGDRRKFKRSLLEAVVGLLRRHTAQNRAPTLDEDTSVFPLVQLGPYGLRHDEAVTAALLARLGAGWRVHLASGYFNLVPRYIDAIIGSRAHVDILTASPQANGFLGARGIMGHIPAAYTYIAAQFLARLRRAGRSDVALLEYTRPGWTFHAKGIWACEPGRELPALTLIGSPNYGYRSVHRDMEAEVCVLTRDAGLQQRLRAERDAIFGHGTLVDEAALAAPGRRPNILEKMATNVIQSFF